MFKRNPLSQQGDEITGLNFDDASSLDAESVDVSCDAGALDATPPSNTAPPTVALCDTVALSDAPSNAIVYVPSVAHLRLCAAIATVLTPSGKSISFFRKIRRSFERNTPRSRRVRRERDDCPKDKDSESIPKNCATQAAQHPLRKEVRHLSAPNEAETLLLAATRHLFFERDDNCQKALTTHLSHMTEESMRA